MIARTLFREEHRRFREALRSFIETEFVVDYRRIRDQGHVDRETWRKTGADGLLGTALSQTCGGDLAGGLRRIVLLEELGRADAPELLGMLLHSDRAARLIAGHGSDALKRKYLPRMASGELIGALADDDSLDPLAHTGSDITAVRRGDHYVVNGVKRLVANGHPADLVVLAVAFDPSRRADSASLLVVDTSMPGFSKGPRVGDLACGYLGLAELHFDEVPVPAENLLGEENASYRYLEQERPGYCMEAAICAVARMEAALESTGPCTCEGGCRSSTAGNPASVRPPLCETRTEIRVARVFVDRCIELLLAGVLSSADALLARQWISHLARRVLQTCRKFDHNGDLWLSLLVAEAVDRSESG